MIEFLRGAFQTGHNVIVFKTGEISEDFCLTHSICQQLPQILHPDTQPSYTRASSALLRIERNLRAHLENCIRLPLLLDALRFREHHDSAAAPASLNDTLGEQLASNFRVRFLIPSQLTPERPVPGVTSHFFQCPDKVLP